MDLMSFFLSLFRRDVVSSEVLPGNGLMMTWDEFLTSHLFAIFMLFIVAMQPVITAEDCTDWPWMVCGKIEQSNRNAQRHWGTSFPETGDSHLPKMG